MPVVKNDLKLCVNHQFIAPSLYNQITQLISITVTFMYHAFWRHALFVRGQSFSVKIFDRSRNDCQVIRLGETILVGLPGRRSFSRARSFLRPLLPSAFKVFSSPQQRIIYNVFTSGRVIQSKICMPGPTALWAGYAPGTYIVPNIQLPQL